MGRLVIDIDETENQQCVEQAIYTFLGRTRTMASVLRSTEGDVIKAMSVNAPNLSNDELSRIWSAIKSANPERKDVLVPDDSPIRRLPDDFSREQALIFDGIRYAAEMADIAYWRLFDLLEQMSFLPNDQLTTRQIAVAMLDVWSIVDSVNRLRDLLREVPGVRHDVWWELFMRRTAEIGALRNDIQHQISKARLQALVANAGQIWGFLSWAEVRNGRYTGNWHMMSPGAVYRHDQWFYAGPSTTPEPVPFGRIRLQAYGRDVYLGTIIKAVHDVIVELTIAVQNGAIRAVGIPATGRNGGDIIHATQIVVTFQDGTKKIIIPDVGV